MKHDKWKSRSFSSWTENDFKQCVKDGITVKEIADWWKLDISTIYKKFKKYGIKPVFPYPGIKAKRRSSAIICKRCGKVFYKSVFKDEMLCTGCGKLLHKSDELDENYKPLNENHLKIIELRKQGFSYGRISKKLNINKSTISYICSSKTRNKIKDKTKRQKLNDPFKFKILKRLCNFRHRKPRKYSKYEKRDTDWLHSFRSRTSFFQKRGIMSNNYKKLSYKDFLSYFNLNNKKTIKCYLTGKILDLEHDLYEFDHIKSVSNKGSAEIDNLGICCTKANASKSDMDLTEYLDLCKQVLINYGFEVKDPENLQANIDKILADHRKNE